MLCIITCKYNAGKTKIKANREGCDCVENALHSKGLHNANPSQCKLYYCKWSLPGSRVQDSNAEAGEGENVSGALQDQASGL